MRFPIQITRIKMSDANYHGPGSLPLRNTFRLHRIDSRVPAWRPSLYGSRGQWWHFDIFFRGFRG